MGTSPKLARRPRSPAGRTGAPEPLPRTTRPPAGAVLKVIESVEVGGHLLVVVQVLDGEPQPEMVLRATNTDARWRITAFAFNPPVALDQGLRGLILTPQVGDLHEQPKEGMQLFAEQ